MEWLPSVSTTNWVNSLDGKIIFYHINVLPFTVINLKLRLVKIDVLASMLCTVNSLGLILCLCLKIKASIKKLDCVRVFPFIGLRNYSVLFHPGASNRRVFDLNSLINSFVRTDCTQATILCSIVHILFVSLL